MKKRIIVIVCAILAILCLGILATFSEVKVNKKKNQSAPDSNSTIRETKNGPIHVTIHKNETINAMYRLYNPNSGEHFYTEKEAERDHLKAIGWRYEGVGWVNEGSGDPVYRLYNPNSGDHHYTVSIKERRFLIKSGWKDEGIGWHSGGGTPIYRQYNPNAKTGSHNFTASKAENDALVRSGWKAEGIAWRAYDD